MKIDERMKEAYEDRYRIKLTRRVPVIMRLDGRAFHSFTRNFDRPYDSFFRDAMNYAAVELCKSIQGAKFAFVESDECSILITDYEGLETEAWFDYNIQKMCSIAASLFSAKFVDFLGNPESNRKVITRVPNEVYTEAVKHFPVFDCRVFNIPKEDVTNYFIWRQQDSTRNSISSLAQSYFSHNELKNKNCSEMQDMLHDKYNVNWNDVEVRFKRGSCIYRIVDVIYIEEGTEPGYKVIRTLTIDDNCPIFTANRHYVSKWFDPNVTENELKLGQCKLDGINCAIQDGTYFDLVSKYSGEQLDWAINGYLTYKNGTEPSQETIDDFVDNAEKISQSMKSDV